MTAIAIPQPDRAASAAWLRHGLALAALLLLTVITFRDSISAAVEVWRISPTYSHCFLIIPIVIWLIWEKRAALSIAVPSLAPQALIFIPLLSAGWWLGELAAINEVQQFAIIGIIQTLIVVLLGIQVGRLIWFPLFYMLFLVPTGEYLIDPMQRFATHFVDVSLNILNIPHYTEGTTVELTNGRFEIAEACAGLRFLIATVTLGVLFSYMMFRQLRKTLLFLLACVTVPLIGNGLRCVGIIVLAHFTNNQYGAGADHIVYGWGFNIAILLVLGVVGSRFRDEFSDNDEVHVAPVVPTARLTMVAAIAAGLVSTAPALAWWHDNYFTAPDLSAMANPFRLDGWREWPAITPWRPGFLELDVRATTSIVAKTAATPIPVDLFVGYYARPRPGHSMTAHVNRFWNDQDWTLSNVDAVTVTLAGKPTRFQEWVISSPAERRVVWSSYWVDGRFTTSLLEVKLLQSVAALRGDEGQAVIALSTAMEGTLEDTRARLSRSMAALDQLPAHLDQANHRLTVQASAGGRP
jgi:exosortase A